MPKKKIHRASKLTTRAREDAKRWFGWGDAFDLITELADELDKVRAENRSLRAMNQYIKPKFKVGELVRLVANHTLWTVKSHSVSAQNGVVYYRIELGPTRRETVPETALEKA